MIPTVTPSIAVAVQHARRRVERHFLHARAFDAGTAVAFEPGRRLVRRQFEKLVKSGVVIEAGPGLFYIDRKQLAEATRRRQRRILAVLGTVAVAGAALFAIK